MNRHSKLLTDLYELTMLAGYLEQGLADQPAVFDLFFRTNPFEGGYAVFAGLEPALEAVERQTIAPAELEYLAGLGLFQDRFLEFLGALRFRGRISAPPEGTLVFANEPLVTVEGTLAEAQLVETTLLTLLNFQTLVATKAARVCRAAAGAEVIEFGLRRAQGPDGGLSAARAAAIGGCVGTSNVLAGMAYGMPVKGTHAHSWVQAFPDELTAFRAYAEAFPDGTILLVDTYDTLESGIPNAIVVARELRARGHELRGIRIDSGDLAYLSRQGRRLLDEAGFPQVRIVASNDLDEHVIESVRHEGGQVDVYGVGTRLVTGAGSGGGALGGVYKLVSIGGQPTLKVTGDAAKTTLPGNKRVFRAVDDHGRFLQDIIGLVEERPAAGEPVFHPINPMQHTRIAAGARLTELREVVMERGHRTRAREGLAAMAERCRAGLAALPEGCTRLINPHLYKVSISVGLNDLKSRLIAKGAH